ncbi:MAG: hypothetical protein OEV40_00995 [Acidimicrobiia bacterium]|nr:hypothetical protein [Acidimicrobiia bacterium]
MTEPFDPVRYTLDDDELDHLLTGTAEPLSVDVDRNPVASFFAEARGTVFAAHPRPNDGLVELFARVPPGRNSAAASAGGSATSVMDRPVVGDVGNTGGADAGADWHGVPSRAGAGTARPAAPASVDSFTVGYSGPRQVAAPPSRVYRPSMLEAIIQAVRPTTTKLLMGLSLLLLLLIAGQAVGVIGLPSGDGAQNVAGVDTSLVAPTTVDVTGTEPAVETTDTAVASTTSLTTAQPVPTDPPTTTPTIAPTSPTVAPASTTTPTIAPTSTTTPSSESTTATSAESTTTTPVETSAPTVTVPTSATVTVIEPTTTEVPVVILVPGVAAAAPNDVPPGTYRAPVDSPIGCTVIVVNGDGSQATHQAGNGSEIVFQLFVGSQVVTSAGCPQVYRPVVS